MDEETSAAELNLLSETDVRSILKEALTSIPRNLNLCFICFCRLINLTPQDPLVYEDFGEFLMEAGPTIPDVFDNEESIKDAALQALLKSVELDPQGSTKKYFCLGQLNEGEESLRWYRTGYELLKTRLDSEPDNKIHFGNFCAAIAELYMTDLCDNNEAQEIIESVLDEAVAVVPKHFDCRVQRAAYSRIIGDIDDSRKEAALACEALKPFITSEDADYFQDLPTFDAQLNLARLCADIGLVQESIDILEFLLKQDEEDDRVWHRLALAYYVMKNKAEALKCAQIALELVGDGDNEEEIICEETNIDEADRKQALIALIKELKDEGVS